MDFSCPFFGNIQRGQIESFFESIIGWKNAAAVVELAVLAVEALYGMGKVCGLYPHC